MITTNIAHKYDDILKAAYEKLQGHVTKETNPFWEACEKAKQMVNLDAYFISFKTLIDLLQPAEIGPFVLLPLDEPPFEINANTREIKVPEVFKRGVAVQGDCASEILVFTIDRYFDYVDLNNMDIWIQYTTPDQTEKAYKVDLIDNESIPGKIRFGWVLGPNVTAQSGALKFAVRFFKLKNGGTNQADYSLSTLPQTINIFTALQPIINETTDGYTNELFKSVIKNSLDVGSIPADSPRFDTQVAIDLPKVASLQDDTLKLEALATVTDNGTITYQWWYSPTGEDADFVQLADNYTYDISNNDSKAVLNPTADPLVKYYTDENCETEYNGDYVFEQDTTLYKKISSCTIRTVEDAENRYNAAMAEVPDAPEFEPPMITGVYRVKASNALTAINHSNTIGSSTCTLPAPEILDVVTSLDFTKNSTTTIEKKPLSITVKIDPVATATCYWKHINPSSKVVTILNVNGDTKTPNEKGEVTFTYTPEQVGYYFAEVTSLLNRNTLGMDADEKTDLITAAGTCVETIPAVPKNAVRVTATPAAPTLKSDRVSDDHKAEANINGIYELDSYINDVALGHFTGDVQNYVWKYALANKTEDFVDMTDQLTSFADGPVNGKTIKIKRSAIPDPMIVKCVGTVTLNGVESESVTSPTYIVGF